MKKILAMTFVLMGCVGLVLGQEVTVGDVQYGVDIDGRFCMAVDGDPAGTTDGRADLLFIFSRETPLEFDLRGSLQGATVLNHHDQVTLVSPDGETRIDLAIGTPASLDRGTNTYRLHDGMELASYKLRNDILLGNVDCSEYGGGSSSPMSSGVKPQYRRCDSGGEGATSCYLDDSCAVSCKIGYYACCNKNVLFEDTCKCYREPTR